MSKEKLKAIFIEESGEIVDTLDSLIITFEDNPEDRDILNQIFRGVHTLKGNSNAFGFTRLGEFVHHFEDLLDYYRSHTEPLPTSIVDLFLTGVDIIKETMNFELNEIEGLPNNYNETLHAIKQSLDHSDTPQPDNENTSIMNDLSQEFGGLCNEEVSEDAKRRSQELLTTIQEEKLYLIELTFDTDIFMRGQDYLRYFKQLSHLGVILESYWNLQNIPPLEEFDASINGISKVSILFKTHEECHEIEEVFEFLMDDEFSLTLIESTPLITLNNDEKEKVSLEEKSLILTETSIPLPPKHSSPPSQAKDKEVKEEIRVKSTIKIDSEKLDELFDSVGELVIAQNFIAQNDEIRSIHDDALKRAVETLSKITKRLQDRVMSLRMVAIKDTFEKMKRVVRDSAKKTGKEVQLIILGEETEIDKTMIDALADPLIHLIRNAIDHGLEENSHERLTHGKDEIGTVTLRAFHRSGSIIISISDDGRGINKEKVLDKAIERGLTTHDETLTDNQIFNFIMQAGFSTASTITELSGRGVGLDVVRSSIEKLRGKIEIESTPNKGSTFNIILPLTLAIIDGMLVKAGEETLIIPTLSITESFRPSHEIVHMFKGQGEFVNLRGEQIPIIRLTEALNLSNHKTPAWEATLVCVESEMGKYALLVDEVIGRQQVVIKAIGKMLGRIKEISGGAILGNGEIALILNIEGLVSMQGN